MSGEAGGLVILRVYHSSGPYGGRNCQRCSSPPRGWMPVLDLMPETSLREKVCLDCLTAEELVALLRLYEQRLGAGVIPCAPERTVHRPEASRPLGSARGLR